MTTFDELTARIAKLEKATISVDDLPMAQLQRWLGQRWLTDAVAEVVPGLTVTPLLVTQAGPLPLAAAYTPQPTSTRRFILAHGSGRVTAAARSGVDVFVNGALQWQMYMSHSTAGVHQALPILFADATAALASASTIELRNGAPGGTAYVTDANDTFTLAVIEF